MILYIATVPSSQLFGLLASCYLSITKAKEHAYTNFLHTLEFNKITEHFIVGPVLGLVTIISLPLGMVAFLLWLVMCKTFNKNDVTYVVFGKGMRDVDSRKTFKFISANLLLGPEFLGKVQNLPYIHKRLLGSAESLSMSHTKSYIENCNILEASQLGTEGKRDSTIIEKWPENVDFVCLQEVWDRMSAITLMYKMRNKFKHFLTDIFQDLGNSNHIFRSSGLFVASKYPILETKVQFFAPVAFYQNFLSHAYVFVKVDLGSFEERGTNKTKLVGYLANVHLPAYENEATSNSRNSRPLSRLHGEYNKFQNRTLKKAERVAFAVIAGDFNLCNISKCDSFEHNNPIYEEYNDYCRVRPGVDHQWSIGTEIRQLSLLDPGYKSPEALRKVLKDDVKRRYYILDADIEEITPITPFLLPKAEEHGEVVALPDTGGKRRVDKILYNPNCIFGIPNAFHFVTALASFTDHIPVSLELKRN